MTFNLDKLRVLVTRPEPSGSIFCKVVHDANGIPILFPTLEIAPAQDPVQFENDVKQLHTLDWLIFVSPQAVMQTAKTIKQQWPMFPANTKLATVGATTADVISKQGLPKPIFPPNDWNSEGLLALPEMQDVENKKIGIICAPQGRETLSRELAKRGAHVKNLMGYQRLCPKRLALPAAFDAVVSTSNESLKNLKTLLGSNVLKKPIVVISQRMREQAERLGFQKIFLAKNMSEHAILNALLIVKGQVMAAENSEKKIKQFQWRKLLMRFIILLAIIAGGYWVYQYETSSKQALQTMLSTLQNDYSQLAKSQANFQQQTETTQATLAHEVEKLQQAQGDNKTIWGILEIKYLINLASDEVSFKQNPDAAIALLKKADARAQALPGAKYTELRQLLANDIATLSAVSSVDVVGIYSRLMAMNNELNQLHLPSPTPTIVEPSPIDPTAAWWRRGLHESLARLQKIVVVRYHEAGTLPLITPDQQDALNQNLHAMLQQATWGLLNRKACVYQSSLLQLDEWIKKYYLQESDVTIAILKEIKSLQQLDIQPVMPKLLTSIDFFANTSSLS